MATGKLEDRVQALLALATQNRTKPVPDTLQGISKGQVRTVLERIGLGTDDNIDAVFALLDPRPTWFTAAGSGTRFCDGATTAQIACHVGILQRGGTKLDREGRDYWIKPLRGVGAVEPITLVGDAGFVVGHVKAKSPNSAYRLSESFLALLTASPDELDARAKKWIDADEVRARGEAQAKLASLARAAVDHEHSDLIRAACEQYAPMFLTGYDVIYIDDGDGDRIPEEVKKRLAGIGIELTLGDAMPDVLLHNPVTDGFWIVEAVTSDGEVDQHKVSQVTAMVHRGRPHATIGFTTAYITWKDAAARQAKHSNLAPNTYLWILQDGAKQMKVEPFVPKIAAAKS